MAGTLGRSGVVTVIDSLMDTALARAVLPLAQQRRWWSRRVQGDALRDCLATPCVSPRQSVDDVEFVALDFETTGINPGSDAIISVGYTVIRQSMIELSGSYHGLVQCAAAVPESSAVIHGLTDDMLAAGEPIERVLPTLLNALTGRVMVAHHAPMECGFLTRACQQLYGAPWLGQVVDTLALEHRMIQRRHTVAAPGGLRLAALRSQYGLPRYRAHNALIDAIGSAELLLAQMAHRRGNAPLLLQDIL